MRIAGAKGVVGLADVQAWRSTLVAAVLPSDARRSMHDDDDDDEDAEKARGKPTP